MFKSNIQLQAQITNTREALRVLQSVNPAQCNLQAYVQDYECGSMFCTLGWLSQDAYFKRRGLALYEDNVVIYGIDVSAGASIHRLHEMFGDGAWRRLFSPAGVSTYDVGKHYVDSQNSEEVAKADHKAMAIHRLECHIKALSVHSTRAVKQPNAFGG